MTYVVTEACIKCKFMDCVEVCPVDCFYEGENMLVINPDECIDCGVCEPECPPEAIKADTETGLEKWLSVNAEYAKTWPNISQKGDAPADAKEWEGVPDKFEKFFSRQARLGFLGLATVQLEYPYADQVAGFLIWDTGSRACLPKQRLPPKKCRIFKGL